MQHRGRRVALTARVIARNFDHKKHAMSCTVHECAGLFESEQLQRFEVKRSVIDKPTG